MRRASPPPPRILIRPNLAPLAGVIVVWMIWRGRRARGPASSRLAPLSFAIAAASGAIAIAVINARLYGSPLTSGYDMTDAYLWSYVLPNIRRYGWWLLSVETPFAIGGFAVLALPSARFWPTQDSRRGALAAWRRRPVDLLSYVFYVPWDAWWYLRFLLPAWPAMTLGAASIVAAAYRSSVPALRGAAMVALAAIGVSGVTQAVRRDAFGTARGEAKYIEVARTVESLTGPDDVVIAAQHSGSIRYYAGRLTVRWDVGDPAWLDRMVDWLAAHGPPPVLRAGAAGGRRAARAIRRDKYVGPARLGTNGVVPRRRRRDVRWHPPRSRWRDRHAAAIARAPRMSRTETAAAPENLEP